MPLPSLGGLSLGPPTGPQCKRPPPRCVWDDDVTTDEDSDDELLWWKRAKPVDSVCPPLPSASEAVDEGSAGPIFPHGSNDGFVQTPADEGSATRNALSDHPPPKKAPSGEGVRKIRARYRSVNGSVYAKKSDAHKAASRALDEAMKSKAATLEARLKNDDYYAYPNQLYPLKDRLSMGIAVYKVLDKDRGEVAQWRDFLKRAVDSAPEFKERPNGESLFDNQAVNVAVGGFAALAHPSSFHNEFARALRFKAERYVVENDIFGLGAGGPNAGKNLEQIVDRTMIRRPGQTPTAELWHRDVARGTMEGDEVFGGWINLDTDNDQYFSCVPGSSEERAEQGVDYEAGFAKIPATEFTNIILRSYRIVIPPGHMVVFNERTIHEVAAVPNASDTSSCRLFFGWRLTRSSTPLFYDVERRLQEQDGMPLKSGQHKHAYSDPKCGGRYKEMKAWSDRTEGVDLIFKPTINTLGFKNYPGGPPMYPSAYWGQQPASFPEEFCSSIRECLLKMRYFNPAVWTGTYDAEGKKKMRAAKHTDDRSVYEGTRFHEQEAKAQAGVLCNFDLKWDDGMNGGFGRNTRRKKWSLDIETPLKPDTMRSLAETECALSGDPEGQRVRWMQRPYDVIEIGILTPTPFDVLKERVTAEEAAARANPNTPVPSPWKY